MKSVALRPQARQDRRDQVRYYRRQAGGNVAERIVVNIKRAFEQLRRHSAIGSPLLGQQLNIPDLRTWEIADYPLVLIYLEREKYLDIVRLLSQRQVASPPSACDERAARLSIDAGLGLR